MTDEVPKEVKERMERALIAARDAVNLPGCAIGIVISAPTAETSDTVMVGLHSGFCVSTAEGDGSEAVDLKTIKEACLMTLLQHGPEHMRMEIEASTKGDPVVN